MKTIISILFLFILSNCGVSKAEYVKLQNDYYQLKNEYNTLLNENKELKQTANYYYKIGIEYYNKIQYEKATDNFNIIIETYPNDELVKDAKNKIKEIESISFDNYNKIIKSINTSKDLKFKVEILNSALYNDSIPADYEKENTSDYNYNKPLLKKDFMKLKKLLDGYQEELNTIKEMENNIEIKDDPIQSCEFYETTRNINQHGYEVALYIVNIYKGNKEKYFRIRTKYNGSDWIFYNKVILRGNNGAQLEIECEYPEKKTDTLTYGVIEWSDNYIKKENKNIIQNLAKAETITVRFNGQYSETYEMDESSLLAFKEIVNKYNSLK